MDRRDRRRDVVTAETIERALLTKRAFDEKTALQFLELSGVPRALARRVVQRPQYDMRERENAKPSI